MAKKQKSAKRIISKFIEKSHIEQYTVDFDIYAETLIDILSDNNYVIISQKEWIKAINSIEDGVRILDEAYNNNE